MPRQTPQEAERHVKVLEEKVKAHKTVKHGFLAYAEATLQDALDIVGEIEHGETTFDEAKQAIAGMQTQLSDVADAIVVNTGAEGEKPEKPGKP